MFHKLIIFFLAASQITACSTAVTTTLKPETFSTPTPTTLLPSATLENTTATPTQTITPTPTATLVPEPSLTPLPIYIAGEFEFPFQQGSIPVELAAAGLGEIKFGIARRAGGFIPTDGMMVNNIIPLAKDLTMLNSVSGNVVFLPFPEKISTEEGQELSYSKDLSGAGWAAYVDDNGRLLRKMVTRIPNSGTIVAGVSFNPKDRGTVYAVNLDLSGKILGKVRLVFDAQTEINVLFVSGEVAIGIDGQNDIPDFRREIWQKDILKDLNEKLESQGVVFTSEATSHLDMDNYRFTVRLSKGILRMSGLRYLHLPGIVMDRLFLVSMGRFMYFSRDYFPEAYADFFDLGEKIAREGLPHSTESASQFMDMAKMHLGAGPVPIRFNNAYIVGSINQLEMDFVSKVEYLNKILPSLGDSGIIYAKRPPWVTVKQDNNIAAFVVGTRLVIYTYSLADAYLDFRPLEQQTSIDRGFNLLAIGFLWRTATVKTQLDLVDWSTRNWGATQNMRSDISSTPEGDFFTFICGPKKNELTSTYVQCNEIFNQTFIPGYKPNSAP